MSSRWEIDWAYHLEFEKIKFSTMKEWKRNLNRSNPAGFLCPAPPFAMII
jgi:hypothetical protein